MNPVLANLRPFLKGFLGTLVALLLVVLGLVVWHLQADHAAFHQVLAVLNQLAAKHTDLFK